ncbi:hypothetical protein EYF80_046606 [Liparis tanakae]|uniref:Uncharacterized protein n=1 Tax=Liparis tanakae TaxID=230148 RepID=A0A4Z2FQJ3_9TELE|nr:hypothetical protein EYF80_046606 [Liparis tanakae]
MHDGYRTPYSGTPLQPDGGTSGLKDISVARKGFAKETGSEEDNGVCTDGHEAFLRGGSRGDARQPMRREDRTPLQNATGARRSYLSASSRRPCSRLSPGSSCRVTLRLRAPAGSGAPSSSAEGNSSTNLPRKDRASSSSSSSSSPCMLLPWALRGPGGGGKESSRYRGSRYRNPRHVPPTEQPEANKDTNLRWKSCRQ